MTKVLAHHLTSGMGGQVSIGSGRYAVAACGEFDHAKLAFRVKFGHDVSVIGIEVLSFDAPEMKSIELPACVVWVELTGERSETSVSSVIAPLDR